MINIKVNGASHQLDVEDDTPLLWVLREEIGLTGTKFGCGIAACGACTVHVNGEAMRSCSVPIGSVQAPKSPPSRAFRRDSRHPVQQAWLDGAGAAVRLLPVRPDHGGGGLLKTQSEPERRRYRFAISPTSAVAAPTSGCAALCIALQP